MSHFVQLNWVNYKGDRPMYGLLRIRAARAARRSQRDHHRNLNFRPGRENEGGMDEPGCESTPSFRRSEDFSDFSTSDMYADFTTNLGLE